MKETEIMKMTKKDFLNLDNFYNGEKFNAIVIVPTNYKHDSNFQCMKYILLKNWKIVGVIGGGSDVIHINGIGGFGKNPDYKNQFVKRHDLRIDCLPKSKCLRLFSDDDFELDNWFCGSDFIFYINDKN